MNADPEHWTGMNQMGQILSGIAIEKFGQFMAKPLLPSNTLIMDMYLPERERANVEASFKNHP